MPRCQRGRSINEPVPQGLPCPEMWPWQLGRDMEMVGLQDKKAWEPSSLCYGTKPQGKGQCVKLQDSGSLDTQLIPEEGRTSGRMFPLTKWVFQRWLRGHTLDLQGKSAYARDQ